MSGTKQVKTVSRRLLKMVSRRLLHLDRASVLWLDRRILQLASFKLQIQPPLAPPSYLLRIHSGTHSQPAAHACTACTVVGLVSAGGLPARGKLPPRMHAIYLATYFSDVHDASWQGLAAIALCYSQDLPKCLGCIHTIGVMGVGQAQRGTLGTQQSVQCEKMGLQTLVARHC